MENDGSYKKFRAVICIEKVTYHSDTDEEDDVYETGWSLVAGPEFDTESEASDLQKDLVERANLHGLIQEVAKGE